MTHIYFTLIPGQCLRLPPLDSIKGDSGLLGDGRWPFEKAKQTGSETPEVLDPPSLDYSTNACNLPSYQMKSYPRGLGIIINNKVFTSMNDREGTDRDAEDLQKLFTYLGFYTNRYNNLTETEFRRVFEDAAAIDHKDFDCLMVAILTHGTKGKLYATNGKLIPVEELTSLFNGSQCPSLIGKPKVFLLQACRGGNLDYGVPRNMIGAADDKDINYVKASEDQFDFILTKIFNEEVEETDSGYAGLCIFA